MKHYMSVVTECGPLMIVRVPWPMPRWRHVLRAMTAVMRKHDCMQKDIIAFDGLLAFPPDRDVEEAAEYVAKLEAAFDGNYDLWPDFWLYDWSRSKSGSFQLARGARV